ncbi:uncharacterized protein LOC133328297 [Musca vetustissima]|uniref:uncharacterized protein LOC133328297 n=1 Tax=Musca vetustissima TaxID=27455 RepID=UPI002AB79F49|nr:uncharacterized protein LOC133328297 [Musca vetustissima]
MAPSQMENDFEYTHKKFNCGYSHKKLGMRLIRRDSQDEMEIDEQEQQPQSPSQQPQRTTSPSLFRPYALDEDTDSQSPRKRSCSDEEYLQLAQQFSQQQSPDCYALKLKRQRAALYMKYVMQYYENGNGWPSVHPNVLQQQQLHH